MTDQKILRLVNNARRWFSVGIGLKRWVVVLVVGSACLGIGLVVAWVWMVRTLELTNSAVYYVTTLSWMPLWLISVLFLLASVGLITLALWRMGHNLVAPFQDPDGEGVAEAIYNYQRRNRGPKIVAIGGGTGLSTLLRGLSAYTRNITAIVTVADDGGSSGRLRREFGILPPGDFRNNLAALSRDEALMTQLLQYRFAGSSESGLDGHAFGNLLITALVGLTGSFEDALVAAQKVLAIRGRVFPATLEPIVLEADVWVDGRMQRVVGESAIPDAGGAIEQLYVSPETVRAYPEAVKAILQADLVVLGPGSLYTSVLPNLLVRDLMLAVQNTAAPKVYVCNLATQAGETTGFSVADHVKHLVRHVPADSIDLVLANENFSVFDRPNMARFSPVLLSDLDAYHVLKKDIVDETHPWKHDSDKLAKALLSILA